MGDEVQDFFKVAVTIARKAGERIKTDFYKNKSIEVKENFADLVTETDKAVEDFIIKEIKEKFPSHKFIGEETVSAGGKCELTDDPTWIVDPIDGTTNFVHGIPQTCISIGIAVKKEVVVGVVYCPVLDEMFTAVKGQGAFCNESKISVSTINELERSVVIVEGGSSRVKAITDAKINNIRSIIENSHGIRAQGSAAMNMCYVARGSHEAYVEHGIHVWDIAAGVLIVREAGGVIMDPSGGEIDIMNRRVLAACNMSVAQKLSSIVTNIDMERD